MPYSNTLIDESLTLKRFELPDECAATIVVLAYAPTRASQAIEPGTVKGCLLGKVG